MKTTCHAMSTDPHKSQGMKPAMSATPLQSKNAPTQSFLRNLPKQSRDLKDNNLPKTPSKCKNSVPNFYLQLNWSDQIIHHPTQKCTQVAKLELVEEKSTVPATSSRKFATDSRSDNPPKHRNYANTTHLSYYYDFIVYIIFRGLKK